MKAFQTPLSLRHEYSGPRTVSRRSRESGAAIIETGLSVALVAMVVVAATHSLGDGLQNSVNTIAQILNPVSGKEEPLTQGLSTGAQGVSLLTGGDINSSKPAGVAKDPPPKASGPMISDEFGR